MPQANSCVCVLPTRIAPAARARRDRLGVARRDVRVEHRRAVRGSHALRVEQVLDPERDPLERARLAPGPRRLRRDRLLTRPLEAERREPADQRRRPPRCARRRRRRPRPATAGARRTPAGAPRRCDLQRVHRCELRRAGSRRAASHAALEGVLGCAVRNLGPSAPTCPAPSAQVADMRATMPDRSSSKIRLITPAVGRAGRVGICRYLRPIRDSNPCRRRERAVS